MKGFLPTMLSPRKDFALLMARTACLFTLLLLIGGVPVTHAQDASLSPDEGEALLRRVQAQYEAADGLRGTFTQQTISPFAEDTVTIEGTLLLQDRRYRIETHTQTLVTDGTTTWIYNPSSNQVIVNDYVNDETVITPDEIFTDYLGRYTVDRARVVEQQGDTIAVLDLVAEDASAFYAEVTVHIDRSNALLQRVRLVDQNGTTTIFQLNDLRFTSALGSDTFTFTPPDDAEVVDLRS